MTDFFYISYSETDAIYARKLANELRRRGFGVWLGDRPASGEVWTRIMQDGIRECGALIVLATPDADKSDPMRQEVMAAQAESKPIVPMLLYGNALSYLRGEDSAAGGGTPYVDFKPGRMPLLDFYVRLQGIVPTLGAPLTAPGLPAKPQPKPKGKAKAKAPDRAPFEPEMVPIPAGEFLMGSDPARDSFGGELEQPQQSLSLPGYSISKTVVTNAQYLAFVQASGHERPAHWRAGVPVKGQEQHPVVYVTWYQAMDYIRWLAQATGKPYGLPSEAEWEKAARGTDGRIYPWGDKWQRARCNSDESDINTTTPVTAYPQGVSPFGLLDIAGNVWEWTRNLWGKDYHKPDYSYPYDATDGREEESAPEEVMRIIRGGSFHNPPAILRCAARYWLSPKVYQDNVGFRVVLPLQP